ncbi:MAG: flagellar protein FlgN [Christensenellales bacterium]
MEQLIQTLLAVMTDEKSIYQNLLELSNRKKDIIMQNLLTELNTILRQETALVNRIKKLEKERAISLEEIATKQGVAGRLLSMDEILALAGGNQRDQLAELKNEFSRIVTKLTDSNELNRKLIYTQLEYTSFCISVLLKQANMSETYDNLGSTKENKMTDYRLIDQKV